MRISRPWVTVAIIAITVMTVSLLILSPGCGKNKEKMQAFVDGYIDVMEQLESKPEVAEAGRQAAMTYASSGYTDLESAEKAKESYEESVKNDRAALEKLDALEKPDEDSEKIADTFYKGIQKVDDGNSKFAEDYAKAKDQTVEERAATAQNIQPAMSLMAEGMTKIVDSLADLEEYVKSNDLEGMSDVEMWYDRIKSELDMVKQYASTKPELAYDQSASNPVVIYEESQAVSPQYIPDAPQVIVYGDGTVVKREDTYKYVSGKLPEDGVSNLLDSLAEHGFFDLKERYEGEIPAGGVSEYLTVNLKDKTYKVSVLGSETPTSWDEILDTVKKVSIEDSTEYYPSAIILHANEVLPETGEGEIKSWPGDPQELAKAVASGAEGIRLEGEKAKLAWKAVQEANQSIESGKEVFWSTGGEQVYGFVYAVPLLPGVQAD